MRREKERQVREGTVIPLYTCFTRSSHTALGHCVWLEGARAKLENEKEIGLQEGEDVPVVAGICKVGK
jgi:hypothetical protein